MVSIGWIPAVGSRRRWSGSVALSVVEHSGQTRWWAWLWTSRREAILDVALVLVVQTLLMLLLWPLVQLHGAGGLVLQTAMVVPLLFRRVAPLVVMLLMTLNTIAMFVIGRFVPDLLASTVDPAGNWVVLAVPFAAYAAVVYGSDRRRAWLMVGITTVIAARPSGTSVELVLGSVMLLVLPALLGHYVASLNERLEQAQREQHRLAEQARVEERVRLAAEMHDVVTHRVSLMVLQAGALGVTATDAATRAAAEDLRSAGCQALEELRDLVGVLRSAPGEAAEEVSTPRAGGQAPAPDFLELLTESESVGVSVELDLQGNPASASPVVARTAYRVVQEALTNVRKHAPGARATVTLRFGADRVRLTVRNTAPERRADAVLTGSGSGTGLLGLRQRVELVSGTLRTSATQDGGFEVDVVLPAFVPTRDAGVAGPLLRSEPARVQRGGA